MTLLTLPAMILSFTPSKAPRLARCRAGSMTRPRRGPQPVRKDGVFRRPTGPRPAMAGERAPKPERSPILSGKGGTSALQIRFASTCPHLAARTLGKRRRRDYISLQPRGPGAREERFCPCSIFVLASARAARKRDSRGL